MNRSLPRLFLLLALPAALVGGYFGWRGYTARQAWADLRPELPAAVGPSAPGLDARLAACAERMKTWPPDLAALREFTRVCHANGLLDAATAGYQALARLEPTEARWPYLLASILAGYGRLDDATPLLRRTTELAPDYLVAWLKLGEAQLKANATAAARSAYEEALRRDAGNPYALLGLARCDLQEDRWTGARQHLQLAVAGHPDFSGAQSLLASVYERLGNAEAAAAARERVKTDGHYVEPADPWLEDLVNDCHDPYTLLVAAAAALADGKTPRSRALLERGLSLAPNDARLHRQFSKTLAAAGDAAGARTQLERAVALAPTSEPLQLDLVTLLRQERDVPALERAVAAGLIACPDSAGLHFQAGLLAFEAGRLDDAAYHLEFTWHNRPDQNAAGVELARVYFQRGRDPEAVAILEDVLSRYPREGAALVLLVRHGTETGDARTAGWLRRLVDAGAPASLLAELQQNYQRRFGAALP